MSREQKTRLNSMVSQTPAAASGAVPGKSSRTEGEGDGKPLPGKQKSVFAAALQTNLDDVRVHDDAAANALAAEHDADAFAAGRDIFFADGKLDPNSPDGEQLLAHEVAHTVQQAGATHDGKTKPAVTSPGEPVEVEADAAAASMVAGKQTQVSAAPAAIARQKAGEKKKSPKSLAELVKADPPTFSGAGKQPSAVWRADFKDEGVDADKSPAEGKEMVSINAPAVNFKAVVNVVSGLDDVEFGSDPIETGFIQNVTSISRHGVYKKDGKVVAEYTQDSAKALHDQMTVGADSRQDFKDWEKKGKGPWYAPPKTIADKSGMGDLFMRDRPGFDLPMRFGGGVLAEIKGSDNFVTTVAAKRGGELVKLQSKEWSIPWDMQININAEKGKSLGQAAAVQDAKETKTHAALVDGPTAFQLGEGFILENLEAAMATDFHWLLMKLPMARKAANDKLSDKHVATYGFMVQALKAKDPTYQIDIEGDEYGMAWDNFTITVACNKTKAISGSTAFFGGKGKITVRFDEVCNIDTYDGERLTATVKIEGRNAFDPVNIMVPVSGVALATKGDPAASKNYKLSSQTITK